MTSYQYEKTYAHCSNLQCEQPIFKLNFLSQKIRPNRRLVLITKLTIHIPNQHNTQHSNIKNKPNKEKKIIKKLRKHKFKIWVLEGTDSSEKFCQPCQKQNQANPISHPTL